MLYAYQKQVVKFMINHKKCGIFLEMGLGKTLCSLSYINTLFVTGKIKRVLVLGPPTVIKHVWIQENLKWNYNLDMVRVVGTPNRRKKLIKQEHQVYLLSSDSISWLVRECLDTNFDVIIVDEFSQFKSSKSKRFKALKSIICDRLVGLTGTPVTKNVYDLWPMLYLMDRGQRLFNSRKQFQEMWFCPTTQVGRIVYGWRPRPFAVDDILGRIKDITISMKTKDYLQLPKIIHIPYKIQLEAAAMKLYSKLKREFVLDFGGKKVVDASTAAVLVGKLQQLASGHIYHSTKYGTYEHIHDSKIKALEDIFLQRDTPILVLTNYQHDKNRILSYFDESYILDVDKWNAGEIPMMVMNPKEGGYGLNLQKGGSILVWYSPIHNMELYEQTIARIYRNGQTLPVRNFIILASQTIDEKIHKVLQEKKENLDYAMEALKLELRT